VGRFSIESAVSLKNTLESKENSIKGYTPFDYGLNKLLSVLRPASAHDRGAESGQPCPHWCGTRSSITCLVPCRWQCVPSCLLSDKFLMRTKFLKEVVDYSQVLQPLFRVIVSQIIQRTT